ncbi:hypothetical protein Gorai_002942 [Gossypium raimondii]|uniref:Uncharacterized protein n=1 Tax=Gossypium raimondii TaxID=29730 RepID=A0A7J8QN50_GOSRA|nr:hypothetical protein [Gossypium raimondii]
MGNGEGDHEDDIRNGNSSGGNVKPRNGKRKPNNLKEKRRKVKCVICNGSHMVNNCSKRSMISRNDKLEGKAKRLGSSASIAKSEKAKESEKKLMECFLCRGPHRLWNYLKEFVVEGDDGSDREPMRLSSILRGVEAKRAKMNKKKQVKCFLCCGPHELQNCLEQSKLSMVKRKATKLVKSSERLPPKEEVSCALDFEEKVAMQRLRLGSIRLNSNKASKLVESSGEILLEIQGKKFIQERGFKPSMILCEDIWPLVQYHSQECFSVTPKDSAVVVVVQELYASFRDQEPRRS